MKKIVSIISIFAIMMSLCVTSFANDLAEDEEIRGDFIYEKGTNNILAYVGTSDICEIPENSNLLGLNHIKQTHTAIKKLIINKNVNFSILNSSSSLEEIDFKDGITEIPDGIMQECDSLNKIVFPSTLKKIGNNSFSKCPNIDSTDLPINLEYIGEYVFSGLNSLTGDILIPNTVTHMGYKAFSDCGDLDKVHLSNNLTYTPENKNQETACWFDGTNIKEINIPDKMLDKVSCYFDGDNVTFNSDMTVNIYNMVRGSAWCEDKYLKGKTNKTIGNDKDFVIGMESIIASKDATLLAITEHGFGKRTELSEYRVQNRGGRGVITYKVTPKTGNIVGIRIANGDEDVMMITDKGTIIRLKVEEISILGRATQGVTLMRTNDGGKVVSIELIQQEEINK